jgi:hypothetical protein
MRKPVQPAPAAFLPAFFGALYGPTDRLNVAQLFPGKDGGKGTRRDASLLRDDAVRWVDLHRDMQTPNLYFAAGVHNGGEKYSEADFTSVPALFVDLDAGPGKPFRDIDDILAFLLTHPVQRATAAWVTGNGVQMLFLLDKPVPFVAGTPEAERLKQVWWRLTEAFVADACRGPQHLFRVPTTLNVKPDRGSKEGYLLWDDNYVLEHRWTLDELDQAVLPWVKPPAASDTDGPVPAVPYAGANVVPYDSLPGPLRAEIEGPHADRSQAMFSLVGKLVRAEYSEATIQAAIAKGSAFRKKYGRRLADEVDRCLRKITQSPWRSQAGGAVPLPMRSGMQSIGLGECAALPSGVADKLALYGRNAGLSLHPWVPDAARFHEHVVAQNRQGVLLAPCGAGKSTWAMAHIAAHARDDNRHIYVVETVRQLYHAADRLDKLADVPVGRVHAFNAEKCKELCGTEQDWRQCAPKNPSAVCHTCEANNRCAFYGRAEEEVRPIVVMTHAGLVRWIEDGSPLLTDARVIVDEDLNVFADWETSATDLRLVQGYNENRLPWGVLFPYSRAASLQELEEWQIAKQGRSFAARAYTYRDFASAPDLPGLHAQLRRMLATDLQPNNAFEERPGDRERVREILAGLINLLRPSVQGDTAYTVAESMTASGEWTYRIRKQRFSLGTDQPWRSMWILNASAMLTPVEYPSNLPVFACPDLPDASHLLRLHIVLASPTAKALDRKLVLSTVSQRYSEFRGRHRRVLIATSKDEEGLQETKDMLTRLWAEADPPTFTCMTRGRIKGSNEAGDCTLAILAPMPLFTTVDDYVLQAALLVKRTIPRSAVFNTANDALKMPAGRFAMPEVQECYALGAMDELYQAVWRAAVRNGKPTEVVFAIPDVTWMSTLWQTVMPQAQVVSAYELAGEGEAKAWREEQEAVLSGLATASNQPPLAMAAIANQRISLQETKDEPVFVANRQILGLQSVINMPAGTRIAKSELAGMLGYSGGWRECKDRVLPLVAEWMAEAEDDNRAMTRRA